MLILSSTLKPKGFYGNVQFLHQTYCRWRSDDCCGIEKCSTIVSATKQNESLLLFLIVVVFLILEKKRV